MRRTARGDHTVKLHAPTAYFITGPGWRAGPVTDATKGEVIARVIRVLEWGAATMRKR